MMIGNTLSSAEHLNMLSSAVSVFLYANWVEIISRMFEAI